MKKLISLLIFMLLFSVFCFGQKGIDPQTEKIKTEGNKTARTNDVTRSWNWGSGKTRVRERLDNPLKLNSRRDILVETIVNILSENQIIVDDAASRLNDGIIVSQPYVFAKSPVTSNTELNRYAVLDNSDTAWTRGRYTFTIEVQSIDGIQNNVYVTAKIEGRANSGLTQEWNTLRSSGLAEDMFLSKLVEMITGISPDESQKVEQP
ncbi:MAG: hypothetical protein KIS76_09415 [Pyrinomonadaceae bacterium]|nr:hypothetical protein [Pyrinomonadaceae bacterium]